MPTECDVLIVGGGLVGSTLAHALAQIPVSTVLVEERAPGRLEAPGFDDRSTALASASQRILDGLGLWEGVAGEAEPIRTIHISERGRFGASRLLASEEGVPALGYTVENRVLTGAVWPKIREAEAVTCLAPGSLEDFEVEASGVTARVNTEGSVRTIRARLLVAADGARSRVRSELGIGVREDDYGQKGVILNCETEIPHRGRAFERFTPTGPLAMLPLGRGRMSVVWTLPREEGDRIGALGDGPFRHALQRAFGYRLGRIRQVGARSAWPLHRVRADKLTATRAVLVGNAAFSLHPVAGQGFNLALRDIAALSELICDARRDDAEADPGAAPLLDRYADWRAADQRRIAEFTHGLMRLFTIDAAPIAVSRGLGLMAFDLVPGAKRWLARQAMGLGGRVSRLARGLRLTS
ncbi:MAG: 2-octaprenyl-6-methoxyphenyl hydroxylase [Rhodospirillaceae bacterium]|nr:2-octaprenyl-6-methoxyphenyl hydroxylase [Rhodospirillaceae bacterium]MDE0362898.1 2-octaprenyl-6-methoxyphenyl hydroxylase [Rhodospirillaceae bacterium]